MEARLRSLANRAVRAEKASDDPFDDADVESLLDVLLKRIRRKRDFEAAFSSSEGAESFAKGAGLSDKQKHLLLVMQNQKEIYKPNQVLDAILTLAFAGTCAVLARVLWKQGLLTGFVLGLLVCHSVVHRIRDLGASVAHAIGNWATRRGLVDSNPFTSTLQMKKWQDQFWQLAVHVVASATEFYILSTEKWWDQPETCWSPTPSEQLVNPVRMDLKLLYISQLVRSAARLTGRRVACWWAAGAVQRGRARCRVLGYAGAEQQSGAANFQARFAAAAAAPCTCWGGPCCPASRRLIGGLETQRGDGTSSAIAAGGFTRVPPPAGKSGLVTLHAALYVPQSLHFHFHTGALS